MRPLEKKRGSQILMLVVLLLCVISLMFSLRLCSRPPAGLEKIRTASGGDTLDVAISYSPMTLYRYADTLGGFSYDFLRLMAADSAGFIFKFHPVTSLQDALGGLREGLYDIVVADVAKTADFDSAFAFTEPVYLDRQVLVQRRDTAGNVAVRSQLDLAGRQVWVEASSTAMQRLTHLSDEIGDTILIMADRDYNSEQLFIMTALGEVPMAVVNELVARRLSPDYPGVDVSTAISFTQFQSWLVRASDRRMRQKLDSAIVRVRATAACEALESRYR